MTRRGRPRVSCALVASRGRGSHAALWSSEWRCAIDHVNAGRVFVGEKAHKAYVKEQATITWQERLKKNWKQVEGNTWGQHAASIGTTGATGIV